MLTYLLTIIWVLSFLGGRGAGYKWPRNQKSSKMPSRIRCERTWIQTLWPNVVKVRRWEVTKSPHFGDKKTPPQQDLSEPLSCLLWAVRAQYFRNVVAFWPCTSAKFGSDRLRFAGVIPQNINFSKAQSHAEACWLSVYKDTQQGLEIDKLASRSTAGSHVVSRPNVLMRSYVHVTWTTANC